MNIKDFLSILHKEILRTYNINEKKTYYFDDFFWVAQHYNNQDMFLAIKGTNTDGNLFIETALQHGYKYIVSDNHLAIEDIYEKFSHIVFIVVKNMQQVFNTLATWGINQFKGIKFAITGSAGKTTTSYLLQNALRIYGEVIGTHKYNSQYYLRRLCFNLYKSQANFFVAELSSDNVNMIHEFSKIIRPQYSIITSIGDAHLENFKSHDNIIQEKTSIINNTQYYCYIPIAYKEKIKDFNNVKNNEHKIHYVKDNVNIEDKQVNFCYGDTHILSICAPQLKGKHNFSNMNLIIHLLMDIKLLPYKSKEIKQTLENINCFPGRGNIIEIKNKNYNIKIICEYHNSNSISFTQALSNIREPTLVIMGYMYSLGTDTQKQHEEILHLMNNNDFIKGIVLGDEKLYTLSNLSNYTKILKKEESILNYLNFIKDNSITSLFIKGSRGSYLEKHMEVILNAICN